MSLSSAAGPKVIASGRWIPSPDGPLMIWCTAPASSGPTSGVLVLPPVGYQWWSVHRTLRTVAERLAAAGHLVSRLDYHGTGDSAGDQWEDGRVASWRASVAAGVADLRAQGCTRVSLLGVRLGATFALLEGSALDVEAIVTWAPVINGRRWAREQKMLATAVPDDRDLLGGGTVTVAGVVLSASTLAEVGALSATAITTAPAPRVAVVDARPDAALVEHLSGLGCAVDALAADDGELALDQPTEDAAVPDGVVEAIVGWFGEAPRDLDGPLADDAAPPAAADIPWSDGVLEETVLALGEPPLTAIVTRCPAAVPTGCTLLFLNTGSEPHVGPGRAWVELARTLALEGHVCVRADWRGWGESPDGPNTPGRPYDAHAVTDTIMLIQALRAEGHQHVVLVGLCASAWVALRAVLEEPVAAVIALNPQLYWEPGDPVEATLAETRRRRADEIAAITAEAAAGRWDAEDRAGDRPWAARWLDDLVATDIPTTLLFAEGDDGIEFLTTRHGRRLAEAKDKGLVVRELPEIDHPLHRTWTRPIAVRAIAEATSCNGQSGA